MVKIMMHGCNGVMGQVISKIVEETEGAVMACGVDRVDDGHNDYPVFTDINACDVEVDAIIDFSAAPAVDGLLDFAVERQIPVVLCTTGLSDEQLERVHEASKKTAVLRSANMSLGVNTLFKVLKSMTKLLADAKMISCSPTIVPPRTAEIPISFFGRCSLLWLLSYTNSYSLFNGSLTASASAIAVPDGASNFLL